jgi:hypothetical protein
VPEVYVRVWTFTGYHAIGLVLTLVCALELLILLFAFHRLAATPASDVPTAVYYSLSTIAQTTAALAGFLLAFVALRLPMIGKQIDAQRASTASPSPSGMLTWYTIEKAQMLRRILPATASSGVVVLVCFLGLSIAPWLTAPEHRALLLISFALALVSLDAQLWLVAPSLRTMRHEAAERAQSA